tara:strand:+ start:297 stop:698 length:402 start_codon:yes stop_codon:yes gene_type:complete
MNEMQFIVKKIFQNYNLQDLCNYTLSFIPKKEYKKMIILNDYKKYLKEKNIRLTLGNLHKDLYFHFVKKINEEINNVKPNTVTRLQKKNNIVSGNNKKLKELDDLLKEYKSKISRINYIIFRNPTLYSIKYIL